MKACKKKLLYKEMKNENNENDKACEKACHYVW